VVTNQAIHTRRDSFNYGTLRYFPDCLRDPRPLPRKSICIPMIFTRSRRRNTTLAALSAAIRSDPCLPVSSVPRLQEKPYECHFPRTLRGPSFLRDHQNIAWMMPTIFWYPTDFPGSSSCGPWVLGMSLANHQTWSPSTACQHPLSRKKPRDGKLVLPTLCRVAVHDATYSPRLLASSR